MFVRSVSPDVKMNKLTAFMFLLFIVSTMRVTEAATIDEPPVSRKEEKGFFKSIMDKIWTSNEQTTQAPESVLIQEEPMVSERLVDEDKNSQMVLNQFLMNDVLNLDSEGNVVNKSNFAIERVYEVRRLPIESDESRIN